jgi:uncharacterized protein YjbJ (UPF0337 family)
MVDGPSKTDGNIKATGGAIKQNVGGFFGNDQMEAEGKAKRAEGNTEHDAAQAKQYGEGAVDSAVGSVKNFVGNLMGNDQMQAEGKMKETKGDAKKAANS